MRRSVCTFVAMLIFIMPLLFLLCSCGIISRQPDKDEFEQYLGENGDDFNTVLDYLLNQNGRVYFVYDGMEFENWFDTDIPKDVKRAIKRLKRHNRIIVSKSQNTVLIELWHPFMQEKSSGLAYSINGVDAPVVEYATEMTPLSEPGWYYYVDDFNTWRVEQTRDSGNSLDECTIPPEGQEGHKTGDGSLSWELRHRTVPCPSV